MRDRGTGWGRERRRRRHYLGCIEGILGTFDSSPTIETAWRLAVSGEILRAGVVWSGVLVCGIISGGPAGVGVCGWTVDDRWSRGDALCFEQRQDDRLHGGDFERFEFLRYIGADDAVQVWLNGRLIHQNVIGHIISNHDNVDMTFKKGTNQLVLKVLNHGGPWGFSCQWLDR